MEPKPKSRRYFLKATLLTVAAGLAACGDPQPSTPKTVESTPAISDTQILVDYVKNTGVEIDPVEQQLWAQAYQRNRTLYPVDESSMSVMNERLIQTVDIMSQSHNPSINAAADKLVTDSQNGRVGFSIVSGSQMVTANGRDTYMSVRHAVENGQLVYIMHLNADILLNNSNGLMTALSLTHEIEHLRQYQDFVASLPAGLSADEQNQKLSEHLSDHAVQRTNEAGAYAIQAQATIDLLKRGVDLPLPEQFLKVPADYIRCGNDATSQCWLDFADKLTVN